jgi:c-di-GMP-related signal transduction protein
MSAANAAITTGGVFLARQPILDTKRQVFGYQLLYQESHVVEGPLAALDRTSARVISDAVLTIGLDTLTDGRKAFVGVSRRVLLDGIPAVLPSARVVLELAPDIEADREVIEGCQALRRQGYAIAVDDFAWNEWTADLVPLADYLKVDFTTSDAAARAHLAAKLPKGRPKLIGKRIETLDQFEEAVKAGYSYFQGFFFGRPLIARGRDVPGVQLGRLRLLHALNDPNLALHQLEELIKHDASLCYRILRTVNSAAFARRSAVHSIREALLMLGRDTVRRWASLWALAGMNERAHSELVIMSTVRARCCEILAGSRGGPEAGAEGFLLGLCSLLDVILERPMDAVLVDLPLDHETRAALMGADNAPRRMLDCVIAYERAEWARCVELAARAGIDAALLTTAYPEALKWTRELK